MIDAAAVPAAVDRIAADASFSGVVRVDRDGEIVFARAYGLANRAYGRANTVDTQFAIASGTKALTALTTVGLIADGALELSTTARSVLGADLPLVDDAVTVEDLLSHRSGIGDYLDEDGAGEITDYVLTVPPHALATTEDYLQVLGGFASKFAPGASFSYCNGGYVVLALIAERVSGVPYPDLVDRLVCSPAEMRHTAFLRSDELPAAAAVGYLDSDGDRTNVLHMPVRGCGDGGAFSTVADVHALWSALFAGRIVAPSWVATMTDPRSDAPDVSMRYGLGFWLHQTRPIAMLEGYDAGVSFRSVHAFDGTLTHSVLANSSAGAWPITRRLDELFGL